MEPVFAFRAVAVKEQHETFRGIAEASRKVGGLAGVRMQK